MDTYSVPPDVPDSDISNKEFIIKINKLIKQKDVLITSLKDSLLSCLYKNIPFHLFQFNF